MYQRFGTSYRTRLCCGGKEDDGGFESKLASLIVPDVNSLCANHREQVLLLLLPVLIAVWLCHCVAVGSTGLLLPKGASTRV